MTWLDWLIMIVPIFVVAFIALYTRRLVRSVADFMAGGRNAGRFLICAARSEQGSGAAVFVASFQSFLVAGFTLTWWQQLTVPVAMLVMVTGYVVYRYRQTRALTLGQFFEMRYSRNFRLFAGMLGFVAGLINFGIIPAVGSHFMVAFLNLPQHVLLFRIGEHAVTSPTFLLLMGVFLFIEVVLTTTGGQISVLLTDCAEGMISQLFYTLIGVILLFTVFNWAETREVLLDAPQGQSLVNPFDSFGLKDFNIWYVLIGVFFTFYRTIAWQNSHAFNSSAATPHEARMGNVLGRWRYFAATVMITMLSVCAMTYFKHHGAEIDAAMSDITDPSVRDQMRAPIALTQMLPQGVKGMLLSICLMGIIAGDGIHLHSWGSIFIQDVIVPWRKKPLTPKQHIRLLRLAIVGVACWAFVFGWLFPQIKFVSYWWGITEAIFISGAGIAIIGGLYWRRGTTAGAWTALIVGSTLAFTGIGIQFYFERIAHREFIFNLPEIAFFVAITATASYILVSLATCRQPHNMDKLLNRGAYAVEPESEVDAELPPGEKPKKPNLLYRIVTFGIDEQFSRTDRWITIGITSWSMLWFGVFVVGGAAYLIHPWSNEAWATYWLWVAIYMPLLIGTGTTIWFTWGCTHDMIIFFRRLRQEKVDVHDDGTVSHNENGKPKPTA